MMQKLTRLLSSSKLAIILLISLTFASGLGVTMANSQEFLQRFYLGKFLTSPFVKINDVFYSWWYISLLFCLAVNMGFCTLRRAKGLLQRQASPANLEFSEANVLIISWNPEVVINSLKSTFKNKGYRVSKHEEFFYAEKNRLSKWGSICFHAGMIIIMLGGAVNHIWGYKGQVMLIQGEATSLSSEFVMVKKGYLARPPFENISAKLNNFTISLAGPKKYAQLTSNVTFSGKEITETKNIRINNPVSQAGLSWMHKVFGYSPVLRLAWGSEGNLETYFNLATREENGQEFRDIFRLNDRLSADVEFIPDVPKDLTKSVVTTSWSPRNPAVHVVLNENGVKVFDKVVQMGKSFDQNGFGVAFPGFRYWAMYDVTSNPGEIIFILGFVLGLAGLSYRLLCPHQRVWVKAQSDDGGCKLTYNYRADNFNRLFEEEIKLMFTKTEVPGL